METLRARRALTAEGWQQDVRVTWDATGRIVEVAPDDGAATCDLLLPAPANCHSHAFQRAMAGLTERRGAAPGDSFWTWRDLMFRFLDCIDPDQAEAIAAFVQMEMLEAGYGASVEFHYLHHRPGGAPYDDVAEMSARICAAAATTGIGLTLLPVLYRFGGCDERALGPGQVRFGCAPDLYARLLEGARKALGALPPDCGTGTAPHSLRAVAPGDLALCADLAGDGPVHMHLAEQRAEVAEVEAALGARPVAWMLDNAPPDARWCLIHCTQMTPDETTGLAATGAVAGLCPLTEASLGDGVFDGVRWAGAAGRLGIGSDSNIRISLAEELRQLDTSQRLRDGTRAPFATPERSSGETLLAAVARGGAQAAGRGGGAIAPGAMADLLTLDTTHPDLVGLTGATALDAFIFAGDSAMVGDVYSAGRRRVVAGRHVARDAITARYRRAVAGLRDGL